MIYPIDISPFAVAMAWLLRVEDDYVDDPNDKGGKTKYGITERTYPDIDIEKLTVEKAREIYRQDYWTACSVGQIPAPLSIALFDAVVHHRPRTAVGLLQQALDVSADGLIGPQTITAARIAVKRDGGKAALVDMLARRAQLFAGLVTADSTQSKFLHGWLRRLFALQQYISEQNP